jgi:hypothetical protein
MCSSTILIRADIVPLELGTIIIYLLRAATIGTGFFLSAKRLRVGPSRRSRAAVRISYRGGSAEFCELLIAHSLVQVSLNITIPSSLTSLLKQARPAGL